MNRIVSIFFSAIIIPLSTFGQTAWYSVSNLPHLTEYSGYLYSGGIKLRFIENDFILAWSSGVYGQYNPSLNYSRLDISGTNHLQTTLYPNQYVPPYPQILLNDFVFTDEGRALFALGYSQFWYSSSFVGLEYDSLSYSIYPLGQDNYFYYRNNLQVSSLARGSNIFVAAFATPLDQYGYYSFYPYDEFPPALYFSTNGMQWSASRLFSGLQVNQVIFDGQQFIAAGYYTPYSYFRLSSSVGVILTSRDGVDWTISFIGDSVSIAAITLTDDSIVAASVEGKLFKYVDESWRQIIPDINLSAITALSYGNGSFLVGLASGEIFSSTNLVSWHHQASLPGGRVIDFAVGNDAFAALSPYSVYWSPYSTPGVADLRKQPSDAFVMPGGSVTLSVEADGLPPFYYQWYEGSAGDMSNPVAGANGSSFTTPHLYSSRQYWVSVSNSIGSDRSITANIILQEQPSISTQPQNIAIEPQQYATLSVSGLGNNLSYQWYVGMSGDTMYPLSNGLSPNYSLRHFSEGLFYYWVRLSNDVGHVDSRTAIVDVKGIVPLITEEPRDLTVQQGVSSSLSVNASGNGLSYQWYAGQSGNTSTPLNETFSSMSPSYSMPGVYFFWVRVFNGSGYADSRTVKYTVIPRFIPVITQQPLDLNLYLGDEASISVAASGNSLIYEWYAGFTGNTQLPLAVSSSSFNPSTQFPGIYNYWVRISNSSGSVSSRTVIVTVMATNNIGIVKEPVDGWAYHNLSSTIKPMRVSVSGAVLSYQWYLGESGNTSAPISGAINPSLSPSVSTVGVFHYWIRILTESGALDSRTAQFTVLPRLLQITSQPLDQSTFTGRSQSISVTASGNNLSYQWYSGERGVTNIPISGGTSSSFNPSVINAGLFNYWVKVSDGLGNVDSRTVTYEVIPQLPIITTQPSDTVRQSSQSVSLNVSVRYTTGVTYQWYKGVSGDTSDPVSGASSSWLSHPALPLGTHHFWVRVSNNHGYADSRSAKIVVIPGAYAQWLALSGLPTDGTGLGAANASASGDNHPNLLKYLMGYDPLSYIDDDLMTLGVTEINGNFFATVSFRIFNYASGATLFIDHSTDLYSWQSNPVMILPLIDHGDGTSTVTYRQALPLGVMPSIFRLRGVQH